MDLSLSHSSLERRQVYSHVFIDCHSGYILKQCGNKIYEKLN